MQIVDLQNLNYDILIDCLSPLSDKNIIQYTPSKSKIVLI